MCHQPHTLASSNANTTPSTNNNKKKEERRTDGGTKEQVDTTTKARQHNGHLHGWLGVEPSATTHGHHNQHHHTSTAKACGSPPTPTQPHNSHQPWSPHSTTTMVWSSCLVCVSQMASDWLHGHTLATSNNTPPMPHPQRERGVDGARKTVEGEGVVIEWKWLAKTSESQAPQQTHHSSNSHQVIHANPQACYTTTKSHSSPTHTHTKWRQARRQGGGTRPACHNKVKHQQPWSFAITHTASATIKPASPKGTWCWCLWQGSCHSLTHTPQGRGEPWLMTRGVHHGSSHSHTSGQHTSHSATRSGACHGVHQPCHSHVHTKGRGPWIDGQSGIHNMPPLRERERETGWWTVDL